MPVERRLKLVAAVTALVFLPSIVMLLITWAGTGKPQGAATWASIPAIVGIAAALLGGRRYAVIVAIVMGFLAPLPLLVDTPTGSCRHRMNSTKCVSTHAINPLQLWIEPCSATAPVRCAVVSLASTTGVQRSTRTAETSRGSGVLAAATRATM